MNNLEQTQHFDAVIIGAGFSGMYMLYQMREMGLTAVAYEKGDNVGGAWFWSRYPGLHCDSDSIYYNYTFSKELYNEWTWSTRYPHQPEILEYLNFAADRLDLRKDIQFNTEVKEAHYDEQSNRWTIRLDNGSQVIAKYFITGVGCLSVNAKNLPRIKGLESFQGKWYHTGDWPKQKLDFTGLRVGVIGTGSSGIQVIPQIAKEADHLYVLQRTPHYAVPAGDHPLDPEFVRTTKENLDQLRRQMHHESDIGMFVNPVNHSIFEHTPEQRQAEFERAWQKGGAAGTFFAAYSDIMTNMEANEIAAEFVRSKIRQIVKDPEVARKLSPDYYIGAKRIVLENGYYETFNKDNVTLVALKETPLLEITAKGIRTSDAEVELDVIVFATGYDAFTGPLFKIDIRGRNGVALKEQWQDGGDVRTQIGVATPGFPNMFMITGPQSPSVKGNVPTMIEQHVEWITDAIKYMRSNQIEVMEANQDAADQWTKLCNELGEQSLLTKVDSWYTGTNVEGKPRSFVIYMAGLKQYRKICDEVAAKGYEGFELK